VLAAVALWLAIATLASPVDRSVLPLGAALAALLAVGTGAGSLIGGQAGDEALRRAVRAGLLVLTATWVRAAAGSDGLREAFRRGLWRIRRVPVAREAASVFAQLDCDQRLTTSARALAARLRGVPRRPTPVAAAVLGWAAAEAASFRAGAVTAPERLRWRARDAALALSALVPAGVLLAG
jgi:hypothetical protein